MSKKLNKKGFTLIEVVLVLAIGGLIFLLAFLAFQNASVNRRDSQRRADAAKIIAEITNAQADGLVVNGQTSLDKVNADYLGGIKGPGGTAYSLVWPDNLGTFGEGTVANYTMRVRVGAKCTDNSNNTIESSPGNIAVIADLEKSYACRDDQ